MKAPPCKPTPPRESSRVNAVTAAVLQAVEQTLRDHPAAGRYHTALAALVAATVVLVRRRCADAGTQAFLEEARHVARVLILTSLYVAEGPPDDDEVSH